MSEMDVRVIDPDNYALIVMIGKDSTADIRGQIPRDRVPGVLRMVADQIEGTVIESETPNE